MQPQEFKSTVGPYLGKTYKLMNLFIAEEIQRNKLDITVEQWVCLKVVSETPTPIIQNDLALITMRNKASLTRLLNTLEKKGLIVRKMLNNDSRRKYVFLSDKGKELFDETKPIFLNAMQKMQVGLSNDELEQFFITITKIQNNIQLHSK